MCHSDRIQISKGETHELRIRYERISGADQDWGADRGKKHRESGDANAMV